LIFGNDIATALSNEEGKHYDMDKHKPKLQKENLSVDVVKDEFEEELFNEQYRMGFKADYNAYPKHKCYEANTTKTYSLIWEQCARACKEKSKQTMISNPPSKVIPSNY
jgi:hypothetical protein